MILTDTLAVWYAVNTTNLDKNGTTVNLLSPLMFFSQDVTIYIVIPHCNTLNGKRE